MKKVAFVLLLCLATASVQAEQWIAATQWSNTNNPNGVWSYRNMDGSLIPQVVNNLFGWGVHAWVNDNTNPGNPPIMFADIGHYVFSGWNTFEMHGPAMLRWTSPGEYNISINPGSGGFQTSYMGFPGESQSDIRTTYWSIVKNGIAINTATMPKWNLVGGQWPPVWATMADGNGGLASVQNLHVYPGDTIDLTTWGDPFATFNVFYMQIDGTPVPEPMTMLLLGFGGLTVLRRRRA